MFKERPILGRAFPFSKGAEQWQATERREVPSRGQGDEKEEYSL